MHMQIFIVKKPKLMWINSNIHKITADSDILQKISFIQLKQHQVG